MVEYYSILPNAPLAPGGAVEVGGKAWGLMRMAKAGLPTPAAFVLPTAWRTRMTPEDRPALERALASGMAGLQTATGLSFGGVRRPLLVSVRSGAAVSMPGMMDTVLDIGLNAQTVEGLTDMTGNPRLAWDSFRRLVEAYAGVVSALPAEAFDALVAASVKEAGVETEHDLDHRSLRGLALKMLDAYRALAGTPFPDDPYEQLAQAALAVFRSWSAPKALAYRRFNGISEEGGTAVTVQAMVYGNSGGASGTGVGFTRDPATGENQFYYDFRFNAQGDDVVAGRQRLQDGERLRRTLPRVWAQLLEMRGTLEALFRDAQDFEFTVQSGVLYVLQTRRAKRTDWAAVLIAVDLVNEGLATATEALAALETVDLASIVHTRFNAPLPVALAVATGASLGVASGAVALDEAAVKRMTAAGAATILVREDSATGDIAGMFQAAGIVTGNGGRTSHAAVVARQLGKVCVVGCPGLVIDLVRRQCRIGGVVLNEGDPLSVDADTGAIFPGLLKASAQRPDAALATIAAWRRAADGVPKKRLQ